MKIRIVIMCGAPLVELVEFVEFVEFIVGTYRNATFDDRSDFGRRPSGRRGNDGPVLTSFDGPVVPPKADGRCRVFRGNAERE